MEEIKIPKVIHYCWFGKGPKPELVLKCIRSWEKKLPDYKIVEWNEENFNINKYDFTKKAYSQKKWAFVSDYARLMILKEHGGIYLDTDMFVLRSFNELISENYLLILSKEDEQNLNAAFIASVKGNLFVEILLNYYNKVGSSSDIVLEPIPKIMTRIFKESFSQNSSLAKIKIFEPVYFYPYTSENVSEFIKNGFQYAPTESYAVHLWNYSWGHPLNKMIKKIGLYKYVKKITEKLGIKRTLKKILNME